MFYLDDYLTVKAGEKITGSITMKQNARNKVNFFCFAFHVIFGSKLFRALLTGATRLWTS